MKKKKVLAFLIQHKFTDTDFVSLNFSNLCKIFNLKFIDISRIVTKKKIQILHSRIKYKKIYYNKILKISDLKKLLSDVDLVFDFNHALIATTFISIVSNFILNNILTFRRHRLFGWLWLKGLFFYLLICSCGALANIGIADYLYINGKLWWISALAGLALGAVFNFSLSRFFVWRS